MFNKIIQFCTKSKERINTIYWSIIIMSIIFTSCGIYSFIESYFGASISLMYSNIAKQTMISLINLCVIILSLIIYITVVKVINTHRLKILYNETDYSFVEYNINSIKKNKRLVLQIIFILFSCFIVGFNIYNLIERFTTLNYINNISISGLSSFITIFNIVINFLLLIFNIVILLLFHIFCNNWRKQNPVEYDKNNFTHEKKFFIIFNSIICSIVVVTLLTVPFGWLVGLRVKPGTYYLTSIEIKNDNISYSQFLDTTSNNFEDMTITIQPAFFNHGHGTFYTFYMIKHQDSGETTYSVNKSFSSGEYFLTSRKTIHYNKFSNNDENVLISANGTLKQYYYNDKELYFIATFSKTTRNSILEQERLVNQTANVEYEYVDYPNKNYTLSFENILNRKDSFKIEILSNRQLVATDFVELEPSSSFKKTYYTTNFVSFDKFIIKLCN